MELEHELISISHWRWISDGVAFLFDVGIKLAVRETAALEAI